MRVFFSFTTSSAFGLDLLSVPCGGEVCRLMAFDFGSIFIGTVPVFVVSVTVLIVSL